MRFFQLVVAVTIATAPPSWGKILHSSTELLQEYDFVVVGGGTAGNVVANRLSENPKVDVLVIEAGPSPIGDLIPQIPLLYDQLANTQYDWNLTTTPQAGLGGRRVNYTRGHALGGSSAINGMVYTRGTAEDYDKVAELTGDKGWAWKNLQHYFRKHERLSPPSDHHPTSGQFNPFVHGFQGITSVSLPGVSRPIEARVIQTTRENSEFPFNLDTNSGKSLGIGWIQSTITSEGKRDSSATSYLAPRFLARDNLHVLTNHRVLRLHPLQGRSYVGEPIRFGSVELVEIVKGAIRTSQFVKATREVILSAGIFGTPHILHHSGIGDARLLKSVGIQLLHNLPSVGKKFTDQPFVVNRWLVNSTDTLESLFTNASLTNMAMELWKLNGTGPLCVTNTQLGFSRLAPNTSIFSQFGDPSAGPNSPHLELFIANGLRGFNGNNIVVSTFGLTPMSRGSVSLSSSNPLANPLIDTALLGHEFDLVSMRESIRLASRFLSSPAWANYVIRPNDALSDVDFGSDDDIDEYLRNNLGSGLHGIGSAAMSPEGASWGVIDPDLKVKGVRGIRIVDASVLPHMPTAHTQTPVYVVAERAGDLIKDTWGI